MLFRNLIIHKDEYQILIIIWHFNDFEITIYFGVKSYDFVIIKALFL